MKNDHNKQVISINSELSQLQQKQEVESAQNQKLENEYNATKGGLRKKVGILFNNAIYHLGNYENNEGVNAYHYHMTVSKLRDHHREHSLSVNLQWR